MKAQWTLLLLDGPITAETRYLKRTKRGPSTPNSLYPTDLIIFLADMMTTLTRLLKNKTYVCNNLASIFYCIGYMPYWIFMPKYIETQYKQSASVSSFVTGKCPNISGMIPTAEINVLSSSAKPSGDRAKYNFAFNIFFPVNKIIFGCRYGWSCVFCNWSTGIRSCY